MFFFKRQRSFMQVVVVEMIAMDGTFRHRERRARESADGFKTGAADFAEIRLDGVGIVLIGADELASVVGGFREIEYEGEDLIHLDVTHSIAVVVVDVEHFDGGVDIASNRFSDKDELRE